MHDPYYLIANGIVYIDLPVLLGLAESFLQVHALTESEILCSRDKGHYSLRLIFSILLFILDIYSYA